MQENNYYLLYSKEEEKDFETLLTNVVKKRLSDSLGNWSIESNAGKYEIDVFYKDNYLFHVKNASSYARGTVFNVIPATQDTEKIMKMLPIINKVKELSSDIQFDLEKYHIKKMRSAALTDLQRGDERIVIMKDNDNHTFIGDDSRYDSAGHYNNANNSLIQVPGLNNKLFSYLSTEGLTVSLEELEEKNIYDGIKGLSDCLLVEENLEEEYGITRMEGHPFTLDGKPFNKEVLNSYIKEKHPEINAYQEHFKKLWHEGYSTDNVPAMDAKIAKTMLKEQYSKERIVTAIDFASIYRYSSDCKDSKAYAQAVVAGKIKTSTKGR